MGEISIAPKFNIHETYKKVRILNPYRNSGAPRGGLLLSRFPNPLFAMSEYDIGETTQTIEGNRVIDNVKQDFSSLNIETNTVSFAGSGDVSISKMYDKSSNAKIGTPDQASNRPKVVLSGVYKGFLFPGNNEHFNFGSYAGTAISDPSLAVNGITLFCRVTSNNINSGYVLSSGGQTSSRGIMVAYGSGNLRCWINDGLRSYRLNISSTISVKDDLAFVFDNTNKTLKSYKNGALIGPDNVGISYVQQDRFRDLTIGIPNNKVGLSYNGVLHSLFAWDQVFTDAEIAELSTFQ